MRNSALILLFLLVGFGSMTAWAQRCMRISQSGYSESDTSEYTITNTCGYDAIVFYCTVVTSGTDQDDCREGKQDVLVNPQLQADTDTIYIPAPKSRADARSITESEIREVNKDMQKQWMEHPDWNAMLSVLRSSPYSMVTISSGDTNEGFELAGVQNQFNSKIWISWCPITRYASGACTPNAPAFWRKHPNGYLY